MTLNTTLRRGVAVAALALALTTIGTTANAATRHTCAHHTTGVCGWNVGKKPVNSSEMAQCTDGSISYSAHFSGTCSHHRGVRYWFK